MSRFAVPHFRNNRDAPRLNMLAGAIPEIRGNASVLAARSGSRVALSMPDTPWPQYPAGFLRITSATQVGANQWEYQGEQIFKRADGYGGIDVFPTGGLSGKVYNMMELGNSADGVQGNGVNIDQLPAGFSLGPIPAGEWPHRFILWPCGERSGSVELWVSYPNPVVGACPP